MHLLACFVLRRFSWVALGGFLFFAIGPSSSAAVGDAEFARDLLVRSFRNLYEENYVQTLTLYAKGRAGAEVRRQLQVTRKQDISPGKALVRFLAPADVRKTSILILENELRSDDLYVFLPALRITRHLAATQRGDAFFGTDLSYEDIEPKSADDYDVLASGWDEVGALRCALVSMRPRPHYDSNYDRVVSCIEPERGVVLRSEFYRAGRLVKRLIVVPEKITAVGRGRFVPFEMRMETPSRGSSTRIVTERYEITPDIPDHLFSTWNLEAGDAARDRAHSE